MALPGITYPALYVAAGDASNSSQRFYLWLIRSEYFLLMVAAVLALDLSKEPIYFAFYAGVFFASLIVLLCRSLIKPEQNWYKSRALAESIKTSTWRYVMRAGPFDDAESVKVPRGNFRNTLKNILDANKHIGERMAGSSSVEHQISPEMEMIRAATLSERIAYYDEHRVREQRAWYALKSGANKRSFNIWLGMSILTYVVAVGLALGRRLIRS